jgi:putative oxidoreductase
MAIVERNRLAAPWLSRVYREWLSRIDDKLAPLAPTLVRISLGVIIFPHGFAKLFLDDAVPTARNFVAFGWAYPLAWSYFIGVTETLAGILLVIGLFTRVAAMGLFIEMMVISFAVLYPSWSWGRRGMEYALFMGLIALSIFMQGGGRYAADNLLLKKS